MTSNCTLSTRTTTDAVFVKNCGYPTLDYKQFETYVRPWIAFTLVSVIPFAVILVCNVLIVMTLVTVQRKHTELQLISAAHDRNIFQMTAMCLAASFCFLVCTAPSIIMLIGKPYWNDPPNVSYDIAKTINNQLYYVNHSANFFLYCVTGKRFRQTLVGCFRRGRYDHIRQTLRSAYTGSLIVSSCSGGGAAGRNSAATYRQTSNMLDDAGYNDKWPIKHSTVAVVQPASHEDNSFELQEKIRLNNDVICVEKTIEGL